MMLCYIYEKYIEYRGHLIRAQSDDITKTCTLDVEGNRVKAGFKRVGRPRLNNYMT